MQEKKCFKDHAHKRTYIHQISKELKQDKKEKVGASREDAHRSIEHRRRVSTLPLYIMCKSQQDRGICLYSTILNF
jgi:hypothetical protein